jgi:hypothetical protein
MNRTDDSMTTHENGTGALRREGDRVLYRAPGGAAEEAVRLVWARPLTDRGGAFSILTEEKHKEVAFLDSLDALDPASRRVAEEELAAGLVMPRILKVLHTDARFGNRYWRVETDRGPADFLSGSPDTSVLWPAADACVIRDTLGNAFEIASLAALDLESRRLAGQVL